MKKMAYNEEFISNSGIFLKNAQSNEITKSLKLFAVMTLKDPGYCDFRIPIDDIKKDFENNGVHVDEPNNLQKNLRSSARSRESYVRETGFKKSLFGTFKETKKTPKKKSANANSQFCVFCENNKEPYAYVRSHAVRDSLGRVVCPKLRSYECPLCHAIGDNAHTVKYCPKWPIITMEDTILAQRLGKLYPFPNIINILNV